MQDIKTIVELSEEIGVSPATLKRWEKCLDINIPINDEGIPIYNKENQKLLHKVAELRKQGYNFEKISELLMLKPLKTENNLRININQEKEIKTIKKATFPVVTQEELENKEKIETPLIINPSLQELDIDTTITEKQKEESIEQSEFQEEKEKIDNNAITPPIQDTEIKVQETEIKDTIPYENINIPEIKIEPEIIENKEPNDLMKAYIELTESYKILAAKYCEATFKIGQLEERAKTLSNLLEQKEGEQKQLFLPLQEKVEELNQELNTEKEILKEKEDKTLSSIEDLEKQVKLLTLFLLEKNNKPTLIDRLKSFFSFKKKNKKEE